MRPEVVPRTETSSGRLGGLDSLAASQIDDLEGPGACIENSEEAMVARESHELNLISDLSAEDELWLRLQTNCEESEEHYDWTALAWVALRRTGGATAFGSG